MSKNQRSRSTAGAALPEYAIICAFLSLLVFVALPSLSGIMVFNFLYIVEELDPCDTSPLDATSCEEEGGGDYGGGESDGTGLFT